MRTRYHVFLTARIILAPIVIRVNTVFPIRRSTVWNPHKESVKVCVCTPNFPAWGSPTATMPSVWFRANVDRIGYAASVSCMDRQSDDF